MRQQGPLRAALVCFTGYPAGANMSTTDGNTLLGDYENRLDELRRFL
jgi:hypothetical protein